MTCALSSCWFNRCLFLVGRVASQALERVYERKLHIEAKRYRALLDAKHDVGEAKIAHVHFPCNLARFLAHLLCTLTLMCSHAQRRRCS